MKKRQRLLWAHVPLTSCERLRIARLRANWTQARMARYLGLPVKYYRGCEMGDYALHVCHTSRLELNVMPLSPRERALVARRRSGLTQAQVGAKIKRSRWWVNRAEAGLLDDISKLLGFWCLT